MNHQMNGRCRMNDRGLRLFLKGMFPICFLLLFMSMSVIPGLRMVAYGQPIDTPEPISPSKVITKFHEALIKSMKAGKEAGYKGRYAILDPVLRKTYGFSTISKMVLGSAWKTLDDEQKKSFIDVFTRFTIATYAFRFDEYQGEQFETISEKERRKNLRMVHSVFTDGDGVKRSFDYQLLLTKKHWRIVNVAVDGISDISLKRAEYTDIIKRDGFAALLTNLKDHIHEMESAAEKKG